MSETRDDDYERQRQHEEEHERRIEEADAKAYELLQKAYSDWRHGYVDRPDDADRQYLRVLAETALSWQATIEAQLRFIDACVNEWKSISYAAGDRLTQMDHRHLGDRFVQLFMGMYPDVPFADRYRRYEAPAVLDMMGFPYPFTTPDSVVTAKVWREITRQTVDSLARLTAGLDASLADDDDVPFGSYELPSAERMIFSLKHDD